jgi:hypothetical protein
MWRSGDVRVRSVLAGLIFVTFSAPARAQQLPDVVLSPIEVSVGLAINSIGQVANPAPPACADLGLPCTNEPPVQAGGFGLTFGLAKNLSDRLAIVGDFSKSLNELSVNPMTSLAVGPRISTGFFYPGTGDPEPGRFFGQLLVGGVASDIVGLRPALQIGGGVDFIMPGGYSRGFAPGPPHDMTIRMAIDYVVTPGPGVPLSGWRFVFGFVIGPRLSR